jgi:carbamoyltransferase
VDRGQEPLVAALLEAFDRRTGVPVLVNTSLNTAGRPMVDDPRDALECFGSAPVDALALGPFLLRRSPAKTGAGPR